jgi:2-C-methyl-D-erythritol 4-phosphate cytidylyltransferase/2-C-methyl-D-erythritol 2,4-cyclodiphosphate synthase
MGGTDKNAALLIGRTMLEWSVAAMRAAQSVERVIVVARPDRVAEIGAHDWMNDVSVVAGGEQRSDSVRNGVAAASAEVVLVHDAARPLASPALADAIAAAAAEHGAAVPVVPVVDSIKHAEDGRVGHSVDRTNLVRSQTPQGARRELLLDAFAAAGATPYTDEAALLESHGVQVVTVAGEPTNLKVTEPGDLEVVRAIAATRAAEHIADDPSRAVTTGFGLGQDSHGFGPGMGLRLGGVTIDDAPQLYGHSDGDVVLHACATAVLSAAGLGDLGRLFPASDMSTKGIDSVQLLTAAVDRAAQAGWVVDIVQVSLIGARPRLGARRIDQMTAAIASILHVSSEAVAISASTGNLYGDEGAGRAISATCLVLAHRR